MPLYKHNQYRRCKIGPFVFENHLCSVKAEDDAKFRALIAAQPNSESKHIVEVNETALQNLERPVVIRGAATAASNPTAQATQASAVAVRRATGDEKPAAETPNPATPPAGGLASLGAFLKQGDAKVDTPIHSAK